MDLEIKERLEAAIAGLKCVRSYYEAEISTHVYDVTLSLPHPGDMIRSTSSALEPLYHALMGVIRKQSREKDS